MHLTESGHFAAGRTLPPARRDSIADVGSGDRIGNYQIGTVVAQGRTATLFHATDTRTNQAVFVAVPLPEIQSDPIFADRLQLQQEIARLVQHPGLLKVLEYSSLPVPFTVMESFDGITIRELQKSGKQPQERAVAIISSICEVVDYLHRHGVPHVDIQPADILVGPDNRVKLVHYGMTSKVGARRLTYTKLSQLFGTSAYVSPEELRGKQTGAGSDAYSIGIILYEMLTGTLPFPGPDPSDRLTTYPIPAREVEPSISPQLQEVIYRAIEREPRNRYAGARELEHDLIHLDEVGVADRPELHQWRRGQRFKGKALAMHAALALIAVSIFLLILYFYKR